MTRTSVIWAFVIVVVLALGAYFAFGMHTTAPETQGGMKPATGAPSGSDTSDAGLQQDTASIDAQMNNFNSDNANVDSSVNDQQVSQ